LYLQVFDYDRFSRDDPIGEVCLPLAEVDLSCMQTMWKTLQPCKGHVVSDQLFSESFFAHTEEQTLFTGLVN